MRIPETVNLHIWPKCNLACVYCYGTFPGRPPTLPGPSWCEIIDMLAAAGVQRVTFSGGEPTLHPELLCMLAHARQRDLRTSIITNGAKLSEALLVHLDLVGITLDSANDETQARMGRALPRGRSYLAHVEAIGQQARAHGVRLKVNTVVTTANVNEHLGDAIGRILPEKWKPMQFVHVPGENDATAAGLQVTAGAFDAFVARHRHLEELGTWIESETASTIRSTYVMVDPAGRLFQHDPAGHRVSEPLLDIGLAAALAAVGGYDRAAFERRGGHVDVRRLPLLKGRVS